MRLKRDKELQEEHGAQKKTKEENKEKKKKWVSL
jgi:hypothetical protein